MKLLVWERLPPERGLERKLLTETSKEIGGPGNPGKREWEAAILWTCLPSAARASMGSEI
jgi:hypothetical protein